MPGPLVTAGGPGGLPLIELPTKGTQSVAQYAYVDGVDDPQPPTDPAQRARCVQRNCNHPMVPKALASVHMLAHWAHTHGHGHNYGTGEMGEWHAGIQDLFEHYGAQVERARTSREGAKHRADVVCPDGRIVEAQTSYLAKHHVRSREDTYGDMGWLYGDMAQIDTLSLASDSDPTRFRWPGAHHRLLEHRRPVFLDRGMHGIWQLVWLDRRTTSDGRASWTCRLVKVADRQREFVQAIMSGRLFGDPPKMLDNKHDQRMARMQHRGQRQTVAEFMATYHHERTYEPFEPRVRPSAPVAEAVVVKAMADRMRAAGWPGLMRSDGTYPERVA